jgi:hypothetical protein
MTRYLHTMYRITDPDRVGIVIATTSRGRRFVKTVADGDEPNNLIALPDCP